jgi:hypothetical protein
MGVALGALEGRIAATGVELLLLQAPSAAAVTSESANRSERRIDPPSVPARKVRPSNMPSRVS